MYPSQISQMTKLSLPEPVVAGEPGFRPPVPPAGPERPPDTGVIEMLGLFDLKPPVLEMLWRE